MATMISFHLPIKPYSLIDAINRSAAATGSIRYAAAAEHGDYNGHALFADYREHAVGGARYVGEYFWAGRQVIARGECAHVLRAMIDEYWRQGRGASLAIGVREEDADVARAAGLIEGPLPQKPAWRDWRYDEVSAALSSERQYGIPYVRCLLEAESPEAYRVAVDIEWASRRPRKQA